MCGSARKDISVSDKNTSSDLVTYVNVIRKRLEYPR